MTQSPDEPLTGEQPQTNDRPAVAPPPLTLGTAGHIDHGKTELVRALTGIDTDRLPEEKARGITIALGYAPLRLTDGRLVSVVDVPGHERLIRVMVSGATGIDLFLLVVAADDRIMPQTREHVRVLRALDVDRGIVAVTKIDIAEPAAAVAAARELVPGAEVVACSARTGTGLPELRAALQRAVGSVPGRTNASGPAILHVDRVFSIRGAGTVVTGTLWSGTIRAGARLRLLPDDRSVRVRDVQVHDRAVPEAYAGQRVALNLASVARTAIARGAALAEPGADVRASYRLTVKLRSGSPPQEGERLQVHHGTRDAPARARRADDGRWVLRLEQPLLTRVGDHVVLRRISPPDTLGGGVITADRRLLPATPAHPRRARPAAPPALALGPEALALEQRLRAAGHEPPSKTELGEHAAQLGALRASGRALRLGRSLYAHPEAAEAVRALVADLIEREGSITLAQLRDDLSTSRRYAQAWLEHFDATRVTRRLPDDRRVLRRRPPENR